MPAAFDSANILHNILDIILSIINRLRYKTKMSEQIGEKMQNSEKLWRQNGKSKPSIPIYFGAFHNYIN